MERQFYSASRVYMRLIFNHDLAFLMLPVVCYLIDFCIFGNSPLFCAMICLMLRRLAPVGRPVPFICLFALGRIGTVGLSALAGRFGIDWCFCCLYFTMFLYLFKTGRNWWSDWLAYLTFLFALAVVVLCVSFRCLTSGPVPIYFALYVFCKAPWDFRYGRYIRTVLLLLLVVVVPKCVIFVKSFYFKHDVLMSVSPIGALIKMTHSNPQNAVLKTFTYET